MRKKNTIILMLALFMLVSAPVSARTFVLSIGIADYDGDEHDLQRSGQDAIKFSDVMKTQTKDVVTLTSRNATRENVIVAQCAAKPRRATALCFSTADTARMDASWQPI